MIYNIRLQFMSLIYAYFICRIKFSFYKHQIDFNNVEFRTLNFISLSTLTIISVISFSKDPKIFFFSESIIKTITITIKTYKAITTKQIPLVPKNTYVIKVIDKLPNCSLK